MSRSRAAKPAGQAADTSLARAEREKQQVRRTPCPDHAESPPLSNQAVARALGAGAPLDAGVRTDMERRFGTSFSDVRIHDDERAHRSAADLEAKAYTLGSDIAFSAGRYAPDAADGRRLLAHELAHVVQQRRGGLAPELASSAPHEAGADRAAAQVSAGAAGVSVAGGTGIGLARDVEDEEKMSRLPRSTAAGDLPFGDAARVLHPGVDYWQSHTPDVAAMDPLQLRDEAEQVKEKLFIQTQSSPQTVRLEQVRDLLEEASGKLPQAGGGGTAKKPRRKGGAKAPPAGATAQTPRPPLTQRNASTVDPAQLSRNYKDIVSDLTRKDLTDKERADLQLELDSLEPLVQQELARRSALRYGNLIDESLTPEDRYYGEDKPLIEYMRRIDAIKRDAENPGTHLLRHGREQIPVSDATLKAIRANAIRELGNISSEVQSKNEEVMRDYTHVVDQTFERHPIVGAISMIRSAQNPLDWQDKLLPIVAASNMEAGDFVAMKRAAKDPWNTAPPSLEAMGRKVDAAERVGDAARSYLDYKTDQLHEGTRGAIKHLGRMRTAGQVAASIAFSPLGGALYGATGSTLEQLSEMHYGQREHFDYWAPVIDAASAYVGGKVTTGLLSPLGKNAPLWLRAAAFVPADRLGAAASAITHGTIERASGRSKQGFGEIMGRAGADLTDWKQAGINLFTLGLGHASKPRPGNPSGPSASKRPKGGGGVRSKARAGTAATMIGMADAAPVTAMPAGSPFIVMPAGKGAAAAGQAPPQTKPTAPPAAPSTQQAPVTSEQKAPTSATPSTAAPSPRSARVTDDPASFGDASFDAIVREVRNSAFGHRLEAGKRAGPPPLREDTTRTRAQVDEVAHREARDNPPPGRVPGAQIQHDTKTLEVTRNLPAGTLPLHPDVINENLRWLQSRSNLPATELMIDPGGGGTRYYVDTIPRGRAGDFGMPGQQLELFPQSRPNDRRYSTEHKFADAHLIPAQAEKIAQARRDAGLPPLDPRMLWISAGEMARWQTSGHSGTQRSGRNVDLAGAASRRAPPAPLPPATSPQLALPLFDLFLRGRRPD